MKIKIFICDFDVYKITIFNRQKKKKNKKRRRKRKKKKKRKNLVILFKNPVPSSQKTFRNLITRDSLLIIFSETKLSLSYFPFRALQFNYCNLRQEVYSVLLKLQ